MQLYYTYAQSIEKHCLVFFTVLVIINIYASVDLHGFSVEELEVDLRRKEKELYLCSRLGLFLAQEVDELINQRRGIISDHTKLLIEMQVDLNKVLFTVNLN